MSNRVPHTWSDHIRRSSTSQQASCCVDRKQAIFWYELLFYFILYRSVYFPDFVRSSSLHSFFYFLRDVTPPPTITSSTKHTRTEKETAVVSFRAKTYHVQEGEKTSPLCPPKKSIFYTGKGFQRFGSRMKAPAHSTQHYMPVSGQCSGRKLIRYY